MATTPDPLVTGVQIANTATTYYTVPAATKTRVDACALTNTTGGPITVTLYLVATGESADAGNTVLSAKSIPAGATFIPPGIIGQWIEAGGTLQASASSAASVSLYASGVEYT